MSQTSRHWIIDAIELIANDIALASHYQELINSRWDYQLSEKQSETVWLVLQSSIQRRRNLMSLIEKEFPKWDKKFWCALKHSIGIYIYATELLYANPLSLKFKEIQQNAYEDMIIVLSLFTWKEINVCGRCLLDNI